MGSDFQRLVTSHFEGDDCTKADVLSTSHACLGLRCSGARPPFEEAMWLLTSPDHFQSRTLSECPPMQILATLAWIMLWWILLEPRIGTALGQDAST